MNHADHVAVRGRRGPDVQRVNRNRTGLCHRGKQRNQAKDQYQHKKQMTLFHVYKLLFHDNRIIGFIILQNYYDVNIFFNILYEIISIV